MNNLLGLNPKKLKNMSLAELENLASDIRKFLIENILKTGGHLGSNLGVVELTIALHYVFDSPKDQLIFDIGHQAYTHKILTGRIEGFTNLRSKGGVSGFTSYEESIHDIWEAGHAGTALSAQMGALYSHKIDNNNSNVVSIIGDGGLSSGMSLEALNLIGYHKLPAIVVVNNNLMSISKSVGTIADILNRDYKAKKSFFEELGYKYIEVNSGHKIKDLIDAFEEVKDTKMPVIVLVKTIKGKGLKAAEHDDIGKYHMISNANNTKITWSEAISDIILNIQKQIPTMVVVPAMEVGSHLTKFKETYPKRFLDVGISEEHAATMSAALAKNNKNVILSLYSTFSQRAYDQILNDIARPNLGVLITIDRSGLIPGDGNTHQGIYDVSMFNSMPNVVITSPKDVKEAASLIKYGLVSKKPFILRYPKGYISNDLDYSFDEIKTTWELLSKGNELNIISYGPLVTKINNLVNRNNISANVINARFIKPIDNVMLDDIFLNNLPILVIEENVNIGGLYPQILRYKEKKGYKSKVFDHSLNDINIPHLSEDEIKEYASFDDVSLINVVKNAIR